MDLSSNNDSMTEDQTSTVGAVVYHHEISDAMRILGLILVLGICLVAAIGLGVWVVCHRRSPVVLAMQPFFLVLLCIGTSITCLAIIPLGNTNCLARPWLINMGSAITLAALFSKLRRVHLVFHNQGRRKVQVVATTLAALKPLIILLGLHFILLTTLTIVDPPIWKIESNVVDNYSATTGSGSSTTYYYGYCIYTNTAGNLLGALDGIINFIALIMLCIQSYRVRDIDKQFSEARGVSLALFCWLQMCIVLTPLYYLISPQDVDIEHFLDIMMIFMPTLTTLFFIFAPIVTSHHQRQQQLQQQHQQDDNDNTSTSPGNDRDDNRGHHDYDPNNNDMVIMAVNPPSGHLEAALAAAAATATAAVEDENPSANQSSAGPS